ncbi:putative membrane protein [Pseudomonas sp. YL-218 TE3947]
MSTPTRETEIPGSIDHLRFHRPHAHLAPTFGTDRFALRAEAFARFFGTPTFLGAQTLIVVVWICLNLSGVTQFDVYPFILLNLAFSLQAAYAAPLILLAQTRQAGAGQSPLRRRCATS